LFNLPYSGELASQYRKSVLLGLAEVVELDPPLLAGTA
jgi:hypothetical protein